MRRPVNPMLTHAAPRRLASPLLALALGGVACGPPKAVDDRGNDSTSSDSPDPTDDPTDDPTTSTDPTGPDPTDSDDGPVTTQFVPEGDFICDCASQCDAYLQDCPEGEKCVPYPSAGGRLPDANKCVPLLGELPPGSACTMEDQASATDDCDALGICWDRVDGVHGTCRAFCQGTGDDPICPEGEVCFHAYEGSLSVCVPGCDPFLQDCDDGLGCYWSGAAFACAVTLPAALELGEPCGYLTDCNPGLGCVDAEQVPGCLGAACCSPYCDTSLGDADCAALPGTTCVAFFEEGQAPPAWETLGLCAAP